MACRGAEGKPISLGLLTKGQKVRSMVLIQNAFTSYFEAKLLMDIVDLLS